jgi:asparagine synthase (glutamine-hydrolysing)
MSTIDILRNSLPHVPFESIETEAQTIGLEGRVYGMTAAEVLGRIEGAGLEFADDERVAHRIPHCLLGVEGDFVVTWRGHRTGRTAVACDGLGRLPVYYASSGERACVSRDVASVLASIASPSVDALGLAQQLLLGYPLGARTLCSGLHRLRAHELLLFSGDSLRVVPYAPEHRIAASPAPPASMPVAVSMLRDAFVSACAARNVVDVDHVLSLSGGMDSRSVGAGMRVAEIPFSAATFYGAGAIHADERAIAARVAEVLGVSWRAYDFDHADASAVAELISLKLGLNPVHVAYGLPYARGIASESARPVCLWTGEGADKILCEHRSLPARPNADELVRFIVTKNAVWTPAQVSALTGVDVDTLLGSIHDIVVSFSDVDPREAYAHFLRTERVARYHDEGEDRHRAYLWPLSPFRAAAFESLAVSSPPEWKRGRRLYRAFMLALAGGVADVPLSGGLPSPRSRRFALAYETREMLRNNRFASGAHRRLRRGGAGVPTSDGAWAAGLLQLHSQDELPACLDAREVNEAASGRRRAPVGALAMLLTAALAARRIETGGA